MATNVEMALEEKPVQSEGSVAQSVVHLAQPDEERNQASSVGSRA
jgi:hypothetical protein